MIVRVNFNPDFKEANFTKKRYRAMKGSAGSGKSVNVAQDYILWNLATEEQKTRVEKLKCEVDNLSKDDIGDDELKISVDYGDRNDS
ncbi:hypothetical protein BW28_00890 [Clostridioides difficile]|nr:hypothetical protein BW28_00890 [Clostridioides difficile]